MSEAVDLLRLIDAWSLGDESGGIGLDADGAKACKALISAKARFNRQKETSHGG